MTMANATDTTDLPKCPRCDKSPRFDYWQGGERTYYYYACLACYDSSAEAGPNLVGAAMGNGPDAAKAWMISVKEFGERI